jgi:hypothetical protein
MRTYADNVPQWCARCMRYMARGDPQHACVAPVATYDANTDPAPRLAPYLPAIEAAVAKAASNPRVPPDIATEQREAWKGKPFSEVLAEAGLRWADEANAAPPAIGGIVGLDAMLPPTPTPTPAAMLGEFQTLVRKAQAALVHLPPSAWERADEARGSLETMHREAGRAKREAEARAGWGDPVESRVCNRDGHRWADGRCVYCGANRATEERRGGPAVERAAEDR